MNLKIDIILKEILLKEQFKTKQGFHGNYIPLPEMLPPILKQCFEKELTLYFTSTTEHLILKLMSWDANDEFSDRVRLPELTKDEKDEGKKITYLKGNTNFSTEYLNNFSKSTLNRTPYSIEFLRWSSIRGFWVPGFNTNL